LTFKSSYKAKTGLVSSDVVSPFMTLEEPPKFSGVHSVAAEALLYLKKA
jgi:hypothetical protein